MSRRSRQRPSDGPNAVHLKDMPKILQQLKDIDNYVKEVK